MKIGLISPRGAEKNSRNLLLQRVYERIKHLAAFVEVDDVEFVPNLGLLQVAAYFPEDWQLSYIDENYLELNGKPPEHYWGDFDLVLLSGFNHQAKRAYRIAQNLQKAGVKTVMGGLHASALFEEAKQYVDAVVVGEAEELMPQLIEDFKAGRLQPFYRSDGKVDLTKVLPPRYDLMNPALYNKIALFATRGCPHHCEFCCLKGIYGPEYRKKTVPQVCRELDLIKTAAGDKFITFADENLLADRAYSKELLKALIPYRINYECYCDAGVAEDDELLDLLKESGCLELLIGFESVEPAVLAALEPWKAQKLKDYPRIIEKIQSRGLGVVGLFVLGFDQDTPETFAKMADFIDKTGLFDVDISLLTPIPGSRLYQNLEAENRLLSRDWDRYTWHNVNFKPRGLTPQELVRGKFQVYRHFYRESALRERMSRFGEIYARLHHYELAR